MGPNVRRDASTQPRRNNPWLSSTPASAATKTSRETTAEAVIKRAAAHYHEHHCGPESIIPEIEAAIRRGMVEV